MIDFTRDIQHTFRRLARTPGFYYAYVKGPNGVLIELNTANHHRFGHVHLLSADPVAAGLWLGLAVGGVGSMRTL